MESRKLPKYFCQTKRQFKKLKRKEFRALNQAINNLNFACFYLPEEAYKKFTEGRGFIEEAHEICKKWWKKA